MSATTATIMGPAKSPAAHPEEYEFGSGKKDGEISSTWLYYRITVILVGTLDNRYHLVGCVPCNIIFPNKQNTKLLNKN